MNMEESDLRIDVYFEDNGFMSIDQINDEYIEEINEFEGDIKEVFLRSGFEKNMISILIDKSEFLNFINQYRNKS